MNELDLNKAVAVKLGFTGVVLSLYGPPSVRAIASDESMLRSFDFCNNWQDAGPIIEKYKITLIPNRKDWTAWKYKELNTISGENIIDESSAAKIFEDKNPLKAAMLCFLEMEI